MTNEEAIRLLKTLKEKHLHNGTYDKALKMGAEALEKQIKKKPECVLKKDNKITGYCPCCRQKQSYGSLDWHRWFNKRCDECGQALDWSE